MIDSKLAAFRPARVNANKHTPRGLKALETSVRQDGYTEPMVAAADGEILSGSARLEVVADVLGVEVEPIVVRSDGRRPIIHVREDIANASTPQAQRIAVASNRVAELDLAWDGEVLAGMDIDLDGLFDADELTALDGWPETEVPEDPGPQLDQAEALREKWGVSPGDLFQCGPHRLICGDCTDAAVVARVMGGEKAGACVTDPPYGINREGIANDDPEGLRVLFDKCLAAMPIDDGVLIAFQSPRLEWVWLDATRAAGWHPERMLWMYKPPDETFPWRGWLLKSEAIRASSRGKAQWLDVHPYAHDTYILNEVGKEDSPARHPSIKPLAVVQDLVSRIGGNVYDPFLGSGTTMVAAHRLGRRCFGCEIDPGYTAVCLERMSGLGLTPEWIE